MNRELPGQAGKVDLFTQLNRKDYLRLGASFVIAALFSAISDQWLRYVVQPRISLLIPVSFYARFLECAMLAGIMIWLLKKVRKTVSAALIFGLSYAFCGFFWRTFLSGSSSRFFYDGRPVVLDFCFGFLVLGALRVAVRVKGAHRGWVFGCELMAFAVFALVGWMIQRRGALDWIWFASNALNAIAFGLMFAVGVQEQKADKAGARVEARAAGGIGRFGMIAGAALGLDVVLHINPEKFVGSVDWCINEARSYMGDGAWDLLKSAELSRGFFPAILIGIVVGGAFLGFRVFTFLQEAWPGPKRNG